MQKSRLQLNIRGFFSAWREARWLTRAHLDEFVECFKPGARHEREETWNEETEEGRWRSFEFEELAKRDKVNLDLLWLKDESLQDAEDLPEPDVIAAEIVADLEAALEGFSAIAEELVTPPNTAAAVSLTAPPSFFTMIRSWVLRSPTGMIMRPGSAS